VLLGVFGAHLRGLSAAAGGVSKPPSSNPSADFDTPLRGTQPAGLSGADRRAVEKELASTERRLEKAIDAIRAGKAELDALDPSDYVALGERQAAIATLEAEATALEEQWLELGARLEG